MKNPLGRWLLLWAWNHLHLRSTVECLALPIPFPSPQCDLKEVLWSYRLLCILYFELYLAESLSSRTDERPISDKTLPEEHHVCAAFILVLLGSTREREWGHSKCSILFSLKHSILTSFNKPILFSADCLTIHHQLVALNLPETYNFIEHSWIRNSFLTLKFSETNKNFEAGCE